MSAMALGLFASLIIGLILTQLSMIPALNFLAGYGEIVSASSPVVETSLLPSVSVISVCLLSSV